MKYRTELHCSEATRRTRAVVLAGLAGGLLASAGRTAHAACPTPSPIVIPAGGATGFVVDEGSTLPLQAFAATGATFSWDADCNDPARPDGTMSRFSLSAVGRSGPGVIRVCVTDTVPDCGMPSLDTEIAVTVRNLPPVIRTPALGNPAVGVPYAETIGATDPGGDPLAYGLSGAPGWLSINPMTGEISGTAPAGSAGMSFTFTVTVQDPDGGTTSRMYTITVGAVAAMRCPTPVVSSPATVTEGATRALTASLGADPCGCTLLWYPNCTTPTVATASYTFDASAFNAPATVPMCVTAVPGSGACTAASAAALIQVEVLNEGPMIRTTTLPDGVAGTPYAAMIDATDPGGANDPLNYTITSSDPTLRLAIDASGRITGTIPANRAGTMVTVTVTVTDTAGASTSRTYTINIPAVGPGADAGPDAPPDTRPDAAAPDTGSTTDAGPTGTDSSQPGSDAGSPGNDASQPGIDGGSDRPRVAGGGWFCSVGVPGAPLAGGAQGLGMAAAFAASALSRRRRRRNRTSRAVALATSVAGVSAGGAAVAGPIAAGTNGWALDRYEPTPAGEVFFASDHPEYTGRNRIWAFRGGLIADYAWRPLSFRIGSDVRPIVEHHLNLHVGLAFSFLNRFEVNANLPVQLLQTGPGNQGTTWTAFNAPAIGDIRLGARVRIVGEAERDPASLHVGGQLFLGFAPPWVPRALVTDGAVRGRVYLGLAGRKGIFRWSFNAGYHGRPGLQLDDNFTGTQIGSDFFANAGLGLTFLNDALSVGLEGWMHTVLAKPFERDHTGVEALLGANYWIARWVRVGAGFGTGFAPGTGTPALRGLLSVAFVPGEPPPDTDHDGIEDTQDVCPTEPQGTDPDPARRGCPQDDRDHDGVPDARDRCVDVPKGPAPDPTRLGCPAEDADHDGVWDHEDVCPTTPKGEHADPARLGCPAPDTDGDGITDDVDLCPREPAGAHPMQGRAGCPDVDTDHDGVFDAQDLCRTEPAGMNPDASRAGCPLPDRDRDVVPDATDHCPDQPGAPNRNPNLNGCPGQVRVENGELRIISPVFFATNSDVILPRSIRVLDGVVEALSAAPQIRKVSIEGHTDDVGDDAANMDLSQRRANAVMRYLTTHGIEASRLEAHGYGETRPLVPVSPTLAARALRDARSQNRRVMFQITDPPMQSGAIPVTAPQR